MMLIVALLRLHHIPNIPSFVCNFCAFSMCIVRYPCSSILPHGYIILRIPSISFIIKIYIIYIHAHNKYMQTMYLCIMGYVRCCTIGWRREGVYGDAGLGLEKNRLQYNNIWSYNVFFFFPLLVVSNCVLECEKAMFFVVQAVWQRRCRLQSACPRTLSIRWQRMRACRPHWPLYENISFSIRWCIG